jgi:glucose-6-phosphate 1-dehydrogenase
MDFHYRDIDSGLSDNSYRRLLDDAMNGDATLFARSDAVEAAWKFIDPVLDFRDGPHSRIIEYPAGSWGPAEAEALMARDGRSWRFPCRNLSDEENYCSL